MNYKILVKRTRQFKEDMEGVRNMNSVVDEIREEGIKKGIFEASRQTAINLIKLGKNTYDDIAECTGLQLNEILELAKQIKSE